MNEQVQLYLQELEQCDKETMQLLEQIPTSKTLVETIQITTRICIVEYERIRIYKCMLPHLDDTAIAKVTRELFGANCRTAILENTIALILSTRIMMMESPTITASNNQPLITIHISLARTIKWKQE